ncbi:ABC transporter substrate-binding protein [Paenibacillus methanolicus]|uniref:Multiple sugar transport system substrate-binding protein n=1 Tax=Paenibacillus methanolicus TaxID=582686 RepID=A0A5S5CEK4_9BACL|nr:ABC transporter substrate-binding protein [Paenibacillus methanolicus]TYP76443.1 multiple sugar transport system substrate-binding protein [Paenibacillus methanolicus]
MKNGKQTIAATMLIAISLLTACGQNGGSANTENANTGAAANAGAESAAANGASAEPAAAPATEPVTIEFWYGLGGKLGDLMKTQIDKFNASQDEVIVKGIAQADYSETEKKLQAAIAAKQVPAAVLTANSAWARKGLYAPMDELIAALPDFKADDFVPTFLKQGQVDGKQYFLPMYGTTQIMYYRKDALEKAGIKPEDMSTWEGLAAAAAKMAVKDGDKTTFYGWEPMWGSANMIDAVLSKGGRILSEDGKTVTIDAKEWVDTWELFRTWIHEDKIMRVHSGGQGWEYWYKTIDDVMKGQAAGYTGSSGDQGDLDFSIVAAMEQPGWEGVGAGRPVAQAISAGIPAAASPEQQAAAMKWYAFFTSAENTAFWSMNTGYIAVRQSALEDPAFKAFGEQNPQSQVPLKQATHGSEPFEDPTGGKINDALTIAADKVQIENVPAAQALKEAQETAQSELDRLK